MFFKVLAFAAAATLVTASQALAWGDMYMGDGTHNPNSVAPMAYNGPNYCPAGLSPVVIGGVICCGTPARGYTPMKQKVVTHTHVKTHTHVQTQMQVQAPTYAPAQVQYPANSVAPLWRNGPWNNYGH